MVGRAEAQVVRLSCIYALLDCSPVVQVNHLKAALAVWDYCESSVRFVFGDMLGDPTADELFSRLRQHPKGLTRTELRGSGHIHAGELDRALQVLQEQHRIFMTTTKTGGRPEERWMVVPTSHKTA